MKSSLLLLASLLPTLTASAVLPGGAASSLPPHNQTSSSMISVSGSLMFGERQADMTHAYSRRYDTDRGPVTALLFSSQALPKAAFDAHHHLVEAAHRCGALAFYLEITDEGKITRQELWYDDSPLAGAWAPRVDTSSPGVVRGRIRTDGQKKFFDDTYAFDITFRIDKPTDATWGGSAFFQRQLSPIAAGRAEGWMERFGRRTELTHAVALVEPDLFGDRDERNVLLTARPVTDEMLAAPHGPEQHLYEAGMEFLRIRINDAGKVQFVTVPTEDGRAMTISAGSAMADFALLSASSADGYIELTEESAFEEAPRFQLRFHAPTHTIGTATPVTAENGRPLPQDGGDAGEAYREFLQVLKKAKKLEQLLPYRTGDMAADIAGFSAEERAGMLSFIKDQTNMSLQVVGGFAHDTQATLWVEGREGDARVIGRVNLHRQDGTWKIGAEAFRITSS